MNEAAKDYFNFVGIGGISGAGKDLFFTLCKEYLKELKIFSTRIGLGDEVKSEAAKTIKQMYGFSPKDCSRKQKNLIRSHLVFLGAIKRQQSKGRYWIEKAEHAIEKLHQNFLPQILINPFIFITDVRYDEYEKDEIHWVTNELEGTLVHIKKFKPSPKINEKLMPTGLFSREWSTPPNKAEKENDPRVQRNAHKTIEWQDYENTPLLRAKKHLVPAVKSFIDEELEKINIKKDL